VKLIVGLGNPGRKYASHRHNVGFRSVDLLAEELDVEVGKRSFGALVGQGSLKGEKVLLAKPQTFMNLSGDAVQPLLGYYKLSHEDLIVVHDDVDIELGKLKLAYEAGHGGHNGIRSIIDNLGGNDFYRVRLGVGRPPGLIDTADYVLHPFSDDELETSNNLVKDGSEAIKILIEKGLKEAQQKFH